MSTVSLTQVRRSMHVDFLRLSATGKGTVWVIVLMPLLIVVMGMLSQDEMLMFGFAGSVTAMCALFAGFLPMVVASNEEMSGNSAMNGIIPATRLNQVLARYALMLIVDMLAGVEAMVCLALAFLLHADEPPITVLMGIGLVVAFMALLVGSMLLPLFYRFPSTQAIGWSFVVLGLLFLAGIVLSRRVPQLGIVTVMESSLMVNVGLLGVVSVIGMLLVVLICLISFLISSRIYSNKEL